VIYGEINDIIPAKRKRILMKENYLAGFEGKIAKLLTLLDRNPYSKTCGCFDRNFWHYKIKDFPSGMSQEFALALALVHELKDSANPFYKKETLASYGFSDSICSCLITERWIL